MTSISTELPLSSVPAQKSLFLITIGAAGSGKGYVMPSLMKFINEQYQNVRDTNKLKYARIDDYIEIDKTFVEESLNHVIKSILPDQELVNYVKSLNNMNVSMDEINNYLNTSQLTTNLAKLENLSSEFTKIYFSARKNYDAINDRNLNLWISKRKNIVFETTGQSNFDWIFSNTALNDPNVLKDYIVILIYPYVNKELILARALNRFISRVNDVINLGGFTSGTTNQEPKYNIYVNNITHGNLMNNKKVEAPRLPTLITGQYSLLNSIPVIQNNIADYINKCMQTQDSLVTTILLYDNMTQTPILSVNLNCQKSVKFTGECNNLNVFEKKYGQVLTAKLLSAINNINSVCNNNMNIMQGGNDLYYNKYLKYKNKYTYFKKLKN